MRDLLIDYLLFLALALVAGLALAGGGLLFLWLLT